MSASQTLRYPNPRHLSQLYCGHEENLTRIEQALDVRLVTRDDWLKVDGTEPNVARAVEFIERLNQARTQGLAMRSPDFVRLLGTYTGLDGPERLRELFSDPLVIATQRKKVVPKTVGQKLYLQAIQRNTVVFGIGPAGTGKTYLAMAAAISALLKNEVQRIVLTRPAVEAGEALGFLPGDLREKFSLTSALSTTPCTTCSTPRMSPASPKKASSRSLRSPTCAGARSPTPTSSSMKRKTPPRSK